MTIVDRDPATISRWASAFAAGLAFLTSGFYSWGGLVLGVGGLAVLGIGLLRGARSAVTSGAFALFLAAIVAGVQGAPVVPVLGSVVLAVVAWDVGGNAISIGRQLGRAADTTRIELLHAGASLAVGALTAGIGYAVYRFGSGGQPAVAVLFLLLGAVLLVATLD